MKKLGFGVALALAGLTTGALADNTAVASQVQSCVVKTHAPGSYVAMIDGSVPTVTAAEGGTQLGVHNINDCLQDVYRVQYGQATGPVSSAQVNELVAKCRRRANAHLAVGAVTTVATLAAVGTASEFWLFFGAGFAGTELGRGIRLKRDCGKLVDPKYRQQVVAAAGCPRRADVMHGGNRYCRD